MSRALVLFATLASLIQILQANCVMETDTSVSVPENASVCVPINPSIGETEEDFGNKFQICMNSEFQVFECNKGMKYDVNAADCKQGPPRCHLDDGKPSPPPSPQTATSNATSPPQTTTPNTRSSSQTANTTASFTSTSAPTTTKSNVSTTGNPTAVVPSKACSTDNCKKPDCFCMGAKPDIDIRKAPMIVMLTFDDAVTAAYKNDYFGDLLIDNKFSLRNPNNCSIKAAFFLSAANTDYKVVKELYEKGNEFASHTVTHILPDGGTKEEFKDEIVGIRNLLVSEAMVDGSKVDGFRAPYLKQAGDHMFEVLKENNFRYDSSISNIERKKGKSHLWPFTLDFPILPENCPNGPCSAKGFPGLWEVPLNSWIPAGDGHCAMIDACIVANTTDDKQTVREKYLQYFKKNFLEDFYPEKVPMHIFTHAALFLRHHGTFEALMDFLKEINDLPDVWFVTPSQVIDWMRKPVSNEAAANGAIPSWGC